MVFHVSQIEMFYVVEFSDESVDVVPANWIGDCGTWCYWPPLRDKSLENAIRQQKPPEQRWKKSTIKKIMRKCGNFFKILQMLYHGKRLLAVITYVIQRPSLAKQKRHYK